MSYVVRMDDGQVAVAQSRGRAIEAVADAARSRDEPAVIGWLLGEIRWLAPDQPKGGHVAGPTMGATGAEVVVVTSWDAMGGRVQQVDVYRRPSVPPTPDLGVCPVAIAAWAADLGLPPPSPYSDADLERAVRLVAIMRLERAMPGMISVPGMERAAVRWPAIAALVKADEYGIARAILAGEDGMRWLCARPPHDQH